MGKRFTSLVVQRVARIQGLIGESTRDLSDDQLVRWLAPTAPSAAWHLWHIARWADRIHSVLPRMLTDQDPTALTKEIWDAESLAEQWGLDPSVLGYGQAGTDMEDRVARSMTFPPKATLQDYARRAFAAVEGVFGTVEEDQLERRGRDLVYAGRVEREVSVGDTMLVHLAHASRHLGTSEGLRGLLLERHGSASF